MTKLQKAIYYAEQQVKHGSIYVWGGQGEKVNVLTVKQLARMENSADNAARVAKYVYRNIANMDGKARCFDCSGLVICALVYADVLPSSYDGTADMLKNYKGFKHVNMEAKQAGDLLFKCDDNLKAFHVGIWNGSQIVEAAGRDRGVIFSPINSSWNACRRPDYA